MIVDDEPITARGYARALTPLATTSRSRAPGREGGDAGAKQALRRHRQRHRHARHGRPGAAARHPPERPRRADDLHDRQPGAGERAGGDRVRRVPLPAQAGRPGSAAGDRGARGRACTSWRACGARPADPGAGGQADRRPRGPGGAVRVGDREAVGRRAAIVSWTGRSIFAYETLLRTDEPTLRSPLDFFDAAERLGRAAELGRIIRGHVARIMRDDAAGRARVRQPAPGRSGGRRAVRRRRRADAVREARSSSRSPNAPRWTASTS